LKLTAEGIAVIEGDNYLSAQIIVEKRLDVAKDFLELFRQYIPEGGTVVDVGASLGDYTVTFSEMVGPTGKVWAFEPNPPTFECLQHNMLNFLKFGNVEIYDRGLGSANEMCATVIVDTNNIGASRLVRDDDGPIRTWILDSFSDQFTRLDFLKIDAEGWEPLILDGASATILKFRPVMLIEVNTWPLGKMDFTAESVFSRLDQLNYKFDRFDGPYGDVLCVPKEKQ
jgi:FkbM family methyltransferase